jgi:hypothetical protein
MLLLTTKIDAIQDNTEPLNDYKNKKSLDYKRARDDNQKNLDHGRELEDRQCSDDRIGNLSNALFYNLSEEVPWVRDDTLHFLKHTENGISRLPSSRRNRISSYCHSGIFFYTPKNDKSWLPGMVG